MTYILCTYRFYRLKNSPMMAFGRSLGGAVAVALAQRYPKLISGVIIENTFLSVGAMVDVLMPFLKPIRSFVLFMSWDSDVKIVDLKMPILFISGMYIKPILVDSMRVYLDLKMFNIFIELFYMNEF